MIQIHIDRINEIIKANKKKIDKEDVRGLETIRDWMVNQSKELSNPCPCLDCICTQRE